MSLRSTLMSFRSSSSPKNQKYFPQQSARKPREKMPTIYRHKFHDKPHIKDLNYNSFEQNPQLGMQKTAPLRKTRLDSDVHKQRQQMLMKTGRNSFDNPQWMKSTFSYYKRSNFSPQKKSNLIQQRNMNIINNKRKSDYSFRTRRNEDTYYRSMIQDQLAQSIDLKSSSNNYQLPVDSRMRSTFSWREANQREVSPKIGALETRDYSIRKPLMKIGKDQYINTYSPFNHF